MKKALRTNGFSPAWLLLAASLSLGLIVRAGECQAAEPQTGAGDEPAGEYRQETWLGEGPVHHGGYGGPLVRASQLAHETALFVGGRGGWLVDHRLLIGGAGLGQTLSIDAPPETIAQNPERRTLEFGYGGFLLGYHIAPEARLHGFASMLLGAGGITLSDRDGESTSNGAEDTLFVLEPELALEANVVAFMRIQLSIAYRQAWDVEMPGLDNQDLSGLAGGVALLFGQF